MQNTGLEKTARNSIWIGATLTSVFLIIDQVSDPVNAPKLLLLGGFAFSLLPLIYLGFTNLWRENKAFLILSFGFILAMINSAIGSSAPFSQNWYGIYGRNTGFLAYLCLTLISVGSLLLTEEVSFKRALQGLLFAGLLNVIYCAWVIAFGDFLGWNNPYGNILGLLGNPNFISSFLGIFIAVLIALTLGSAQSISVKLAALGVALIAFYEVVNSNAVQGLVVTAGGLALIGFFYIRSRFSSAWPVLSYSLVTLALGVAAIFGALQKGPLSFIYKTSVSLRGEYWQAGFEMGKSHLFSGVGMDGYGDWYRRARSIEAATVLPGPNTVTNAAHNVVMDIFAYGGLPLLICYLGMILLSLISALRFMKRAKKYDPIFVALFVGWICYQVQSLISINQIGLAIWGWVFGGLLIAYERSTRTSQVASDSNQIRDRSKSVRNTSASVFSPQLVSALAAVVGLFVASPALAADMKWRSALKSQDVIKVMAVFEPSFLNPQNSFKYLDAARALATSNFQDKAHEVILRAIEFNPDSFDAWKVLYFLQVSTPEEKAKALENMKRLDPRNPDVTAQ